MKSSIVLKRNQWMIGLVIMMMVALLVPQSALAVELPVPPVSVDLLAGQYTDAGNVNVWNDSQNLYVQYMTADGWLMTETHLAVAASLSGIPQTPGKKATAIPGKFAYKNTYSPSVNGDTYVIPLSAFGFQYDQTIFVAAHAVVEKTMADGSYRNETGWAAGTKFGGSWGMYLQYTIEKPEVVNDQPAFTDAGSAWGVGIDIAKQGNGDYFVFDDLTTDKTVVLGMGRNYTDIGTVTAHYDAATRNISVTFATRDPYYMNQTHLYIDDVVPTVTAPGQYEFQYTVDAAADYYQTHSYTVNAGDRFDTNNDGVIDGPIYVAAHAHILSSGK